MDDILIYTITIHACDTSLRSEKSQKSPRSQAGEAGGAEKTLQERLWEMANGKTSDGDELEPRADRPPLIERPPLMERPQTADSSQ